MTETTEETTPDELAKKEAPVASNIAVIDMPLNEQTLKSLMPTLPERYESFADVVATIMVGRELGIPEMTALQELYVVNGSVSMSAKIAASLARQKGYRFKIVHDETQASVTAYEPDGFEIGVFTFTREDAEQAGLMGKGAYKKYPKDMLLNKALMRAVRFAFPDAIMGYHTQELALEIAPDTPAGLDAARIEPLDEEQMEELVAVFEDAEVVEDGDPEIVNLETGEIIGVKDGD